MFGEGRFKTASPEPAEVTGRENMAFFKGSTILQSRPLVAVECSQIPSPRPPRGGPAKVAEFQWSICKRAVQHSINMQPSAPFTSRCSSIDG